MPSPVSSSAPGCHFGSFEFNPTTGELRNGGTEVRLPPQPARLLTLLAAHPGQLVTREEIRREIWGEGTFVDFELGLNFCINRVRAALGDDARAPVYIETVPKRGYRFIAPVGTPQTRPTLAVLPFDNLNRDPEKDYFADGVVDALITQLGRIRGLRVISRQSTLHWKGSATPLPEIARELGADAVIEGSVLHAGTRVRISAQLIRIDPEEHVWAQSYEREMSDVLSIQREIASAVAERVQLMLTPEDPSHLARPETVHPDAYEAFLKGEFYTNRWSREGFRRGLEYLQQAIALDPSFAPAYASMAHCYSLLGFWGHIDPQQAEPMAREAACKALALNDSLALAHAARAWIAVHYDWNFALCDSELKRALELNQSELLAHSVSAVSRILQGDIAQGMTATREMLRLDPVSVYTNVTASWFFLFARRFEDAKSQARKAIDMYPEALQAWYTLGWAEVGLGRYDEAVAALQRAACISRDAMSLGYLGHALARNGQRAAAKALLRELLEQSTREFVPAKPLICLYAGLGEIDHAFERIEKAYQDRDGIVLWLDVGPPFDPLRDDGRFSEMLRRVGLPPPRALVSR